jgi:hypothetical protein
VAAHRRDTLAATVAAARAGLGQTRFTSAWETGRGWSLDQAVAAAQTVAATLA